MFVYDVSKVLLVFLLALVIVSLAVLIGFVAHWCAQCIWNRTQHVIMDRWMRMEDCFARRPLRRRNFSYQRKLFIGTVLNISSWVVGSQKRYSRTTYLEDQDSEQAIQARKILRKKGALRCHTRFQQKYIDQLVNDQAALLIEIHGLNIFTTGDIRERQITLEKKLQRTQRYLRELDPIRIDNSHYMSFGEEGWESNGFGYY